MRYLSFTYNGLYVTRGLLGQAASHAKIFEIECRVWSFSYDRHTCEKAHHLFDLNFSPVIATAALIPPYIDHRYTIAFQIDEIDPWMIGRLEFEMNSFKGINMQGEPSDEEWANGTALELDRRVLARWIDMAHTEFDQRLIPIVPPVVIEGRVC